MQLKQYLILQLNEKFDPNTQYDMLCTYVEKRELNSTLEDIISDFHSCLHACFKDMRKNHVQCVDPLKVEIEKLRKTIDFLQGDHIIDVDVILDTITRLNMVSM